MGAGDDQAKGLALREAKPRRVRLRPMTCQHCGSEFQAQRSTAKFCSVPCARRAAWPVTKTRQCRHCGRDFQVTGRGDANRQLCSRACEKNRAAKKVKEWQADHPDLARQHSRAWASRNPAYYSTAKRTQRAKILDLLGGQCLVCGVCNPVWLHIDFIPGSRGLQYRHSRGFKYVTENLELFRILCANHHYELTLTGRIEGTEITQ